MFAFLKSVGDQLQSSASVKTVFGEPVHANGTVVIPVARIKYGFGGGGGVHAPAVQPNSTINSQHREGGGGGGGISVTPIGVVEISDGKTRFIRFRHGHLRIIGPIVAAVTFCWFIRREKRIRQLKD